MQYINDVRRWGCINLHEAIGLAVFRFRIILGRDRQINTLLDVQHSGDDVTVYSHAGASVTTSALLLNANYDPIKVIPWKRAVELLLDERAEMVEEYVGKFVRSVSDAIPWPAVLRLKKFLPGRPRMRFTRLNVLARDNYKCSYCGVAPKKKNGTPLLEDLTLDHVIPRAQSKNGTVKSITGTIVSVTCWLNVTCSCTTCNMKKADRTPGQAGMKLLVQPRAPSGLDVLRMHMRKIAIPTEWVQWLPPGSAAWGNYWDAELDAD